MLLAVEGRFRDARVIFRLRVLVVVNQSGVGLCHRSEHKGVRVGGLHRVTVRVLVGQLVLVERLLVLVSLKWLVQVIKLVLVVLGLLGRGKRLILERDVVVLKEMELWLLDVVSKGDVVVGVQILGGFGGSS